MSRRMAAIRFNRLMVTPQPWKGRHLKKRGCFACRTYLELLSVLPKWCTGSSWALRTCYKAIESLRKLREAEPSIASVPIKKKTFPASLSF